MCGEKPALPLLLWLVGPQLPGNVPRQGERSLAALILWIVLQHKLAVFVPDKGAAYVYLTALKVDTVPTET